MSVQLAVLERFKQGFVISGGLTVLPAGFLKSFIFQLLICSADLGVKPELAL